mmetsp:Transcript_105128/g.292784  ORF Transcript_105128/g.292784 Transcript_105128/m.292784 type:complete len:274 (-) Transcript_105128:146-967(-)
MPGANSGLGLTLYACRHVAVSGLDGGGGAELGGFARGALPSDPRRAGGHKRGPPRSHRGSGSHDRRHSQQSGSCPGPGCRWRAKRRSKRRPRWRPGRRTGLRTHCRGLGVVAIARAVSGLAICARAPPHSRRHAARRHSAASPVGGSGGRPRQRRGQVPGVCAAQLAGRLPGGHEAALLPAPEALAAPPAPLPRRGAGLRGGRAERRERPGAALAALGVHRLPGLRRALAAARRLAAAPATGAGRRGRATGDGAAPAGAPAGRRPRLRCRLCG